MEVTVAKSAGFCFGVKRAIDTVYQEIEKGEQEIGRASCRERV